MGKTVKSVEVRTKDKTYKIFIGDLILHQIIKTRKEISADRFALIVSARIMELYSDNIKEIFRGVKNVEVFKMHDGEKNKIYKYAERFLDDMLKSGFTRRSVVIGIGGGVVGDFAGFIASVYMRGIPIIHIPTTLLAMVDSSIGGKTAVNLSAGKNIAGSFHQPHMVISDVNFIRTLPENELKNGLSEVLKHALIGEEKLLKILDKNDLKSIKISDIIQKIIFLSVLFKSRIVEKDEDEKGIRAILNFGHTVGHAIESMSGYKGISHGEAVAIGLKIETEISRRIGWLDNGEVSYVNELISHYNLINKTNKFNAEKIVEHMKFDKKNIGGKFKFVLLKGLHNPVYNQEVDFKLVMDAVRCINS
ncbi:MAG: 3-dehydroquinate synthase [Spirochaetes bacterium]|nr:3-dehydroquinate synthase [Spirochaetota bacterium]